MCRPKTRQNVRWDICLQYTWRCDAGQINGTVIPMQKAINNVIVKSGINTKSGSGSFVHSCHLGAYFNGDYQNKGWWQWIVIGTMNMQQAVTKYWDSNNTTDNATFDCYWDPTNKLDMPFMCNKSCANRAWPPYLARENSSLVMSVLG